MNTIYANIVNLPEVIKTPKGRTLNHIGNYDYAYGTETAFVVVNIYNNSIKARFVDTRTANVYPEVDGDTIDIAIEEAMKARDHYIVSDEM